MPFLEETLQTDISYGSRFGAEFSVDVIESAVNRYTVALHPFKIARFAINFANKTLAAQISKTLDLFDRCGGMAGGFLITNRADYSSNNYIGVPTYQDQLCQEISAVAKTYQLMRWYGTPGATTPRRMIKKPQAGTILVSIKNGATYTPTAAYTVDTTTGIITLTNALGVGDTLYAGFYFNIPVQFESDLSGTDWQTRLANNEYILSNTINLIEVLNPEDIA